MKFEIQEPMFKTGDVVSTSLLNAPSARAIAEILEATVEFTGCIRNGIMSLGQAEVIYMISLQPGSCDHIGHPMKPGTILCVYEEDMVNVDLVQERSAIIIQKS